MRRKDEQKEHRRKKILQIVIGVLLVGTMFISTFSVYLSNQDTKPRFNGYTFNVEQVGKSVDFTTKTQGQTRSFHALPLSDVNGTVSVQNILGNTILVDLDPSVEQLVKGATYLATTFDANASTQDLPFIELARFHYAQSLKNVINGVLVPQGAYSALPQINCSMASASTPVVRFLIDNETTQHASVTREGACVTVLGDREGVLAGKDVLLLAQFGVLDHA